ncbi:MAG: hypothetical protein M1166_00865, partial [Candidatus Thermoplasmatota archaeon]|nr:hypothetical protein [Candidatus Thermoplasmatota archaeon]
TTAAKRTLSIIIPGPLFLFSTLKKTNVNILGITTQKVLECDKNYQKKFHLSYVHISKVNNQSVIASIFVIYPLAMLIV